MPKIKLVWCDMVGSDYDITRIVGTSGDWQEVSLEDLTILKSNTRIIQKVLRPTSYNERLYIIEEEILPVKELIRQVNKALHDEAGHRVIVEKRAKRDAAERAKKSAERKKKQYEKLKREFEG